MPYRGGYSYLSSKINKLNQREFIKKSKKGAILIEFAFAVPILFSLMYYVQDLARYKQIQQRLQFAAEEIASNLQNIAKMKGSALNSTDLANAIGSANLSVFPGKTQYTQSSGWTDSALGYISVTRVHFVKCIAPNIAEIKWCCRFNSWGDKYYFSKNTSEPYQQETKINSWKGKPEDIYSDLRLSENETKIIVEHKFETNKKDSGIFGFYFLDPLKSYTTTTQLFNSIVIFSPVPGAFSDTPPQ